MSDQHAAPASDAPLQDLAASVTGRLLAPGDAEFDAARQLFNAAVDKRPAAILRPADASDVARAVSFAGEHGLELAIRGGGHGFAGHGVSDGGLTIDMSTLRGLEIDPAGRTAWAQAGLTTGEYTDAVAEHGLATGFGDTGSVGVAGITLGGGIGWLVRKHGLTIDQLLAVELVTADGELRTVDAESDPDLFWALRGGGGNFGVATRLRFRLCDVDRIYGGMLMLPATPEIVGGFLAAAHAAPEELSTIANVMPAPPLPFVPAEHHGSPILLITLVHTDPGTGEQAVAPLRALATPIADMVSEMSYPEIFTLGEGGPERAAFTMRSGFRDELDQTAIETILDRIESRGQHMAVFQLRPLGGAMARVPADATAFAHRDRRTMIVIGAMSERVDDAPTLKTWADGSATALGLSGDDVYVNYLGDDGPDRIRQAYPGGAYERLAALKRRYDPNNLFRANHNVTPAG